MKQRVIDGNSLEFFNDDNSKKGEIKISGSDVIINPIDSSGTVIFGEEGTINDIEIGASGTPVDFTFLGGGTITSNGNTLTLGKSGDTVDLSNATIGTITASIFKGGQFIGDGSGLTGTPSTFTNITASGNISASGTGSFARMSIGTATPSTNILRVDNESDNTQAIFSARRSSTFEFKIKQFAQIESKINGETTHEIYNTNTGASAPLLKLGHNNAGIAHITTYYTDNSLNLDGSHGVHVLSNLTASGDISASGDIFGGRLGILETNPEGLLHVSNPNDSGTTRTSVFEHRFGVNDTSQYARYGIMVKSADLTCALGITNQTYNSVLQSQLYASPFTAKDIALQPLGGSVLIGRHATSGTTEGRLTIEGFGSGSSTNALAIQDSSTTTVASIKDDGSATFTNITSSGNISASGTITGLTGSFNKGIINLPSAAANEKILQVQKAGSDVFFVDEDGDGVFSGVVEFKNFAYGSTGDTFVGGREDLVLGMNWNNDTAGTSIKFTTNEFTNSPSNTLMTISSSGDVGIGTTSPTHKLHIVDGSDSFKYGSDIDNGFDGIKLTGGAPGVHFVGPGDDFIIGKITAGVAFFNNTDSQYKMILNDDGNLGIGTTFTSATPPEKLTVQGNISASGGIQVGFGTFSGTTDTKTDAAIVIPEDKAIYTLDSSGAHLRNLIRMDSDVIKIGQGPTVLIDEIRLQPGSFGFTSFYSASAEVARVDIEGNITASGNISASGNLSVNQLTASANLHLTTANIFTPASTVDFFAIGSSAKATRARSGQFSTTYSGTIPDNGILFSTDTTLQRTAATTLTLNGTLITSGNISASGEILTISTGSATRPALGYQSNGGFTGIFSSTGLDRMDFSIGGTSKLVFDTSRARFGQSSLAPLIEYESQTGGPSYTYEDDQDTGVGRKSANTLALYAGGETVNINGTTGLTVVQGGVSTTGARGNISSNSHITASGNVSASGQGSFGSLIVNGVALGDSTVLSAGTATVATNVTAVATTDDAEFFVGLLDGASGTQAVETNTRFKFNPNDGKLTFTGNISASGHISASEFVGGQGNSDVDTGTETVATATNATAAFFDYVAKNGTNLRAGTVTSVTDGSNVEFNEVSTVDLGDTTDVKFSVVLSSGNLLLKATVLSDNWNIRALVRKL